MEFTEKLPEWKNEGAEPSDTLKNTGWKEFDYPAASVFNWQWFRSFKAFNELRTELEKIPSVERLQVLDNTTVTAEALNYLLEMIRYEPYLESDRENDETAGSVSSVNSWVKGMHAFAFGYQNIANAYQTVFGRFNEEKTGGNLTTQLLSNSLFIIGNGTAETESGAGDMVRSNAFRITESGKVYAQNQTLSSGAGVAEMYEWLDGNSDNEDRRGLFITLEGDKIRVATPQDDYILGVVDPFPFIVGDVQSEGWKNKYLTDIFGEKLTEIVDVAEKRDEKGKVIMPAHKAERYIINPEYNPKMEYMSRDERQEFAAITSKGKVVMIDDGSCKVNSYCTVGEGGIATASENNYAVRVLERIDDTHIRVLIDSVFINK